MSACASKPSLKELEDDYFDCKAAQAQGCDLIAAEIDKRYEAKRKKALREQRRIYNRCRSGGVTCIKVKTWEN